MEEQSYAKHAKFVPMFHFGLFGVIVVAFFLSLWNVYKHIGDSAGRTSILILALLSVAVLLLFFFLRGFAMTVQDRAIRAEENLRHYVLTGKLLDRRLTVKQIVGLRFASDEEFPGLARKAADENLSLDAVKKSVKNWRADHDRA